MFYKKKSVWSVPLLLGFSVTFFSPAGCGPSGIAVVPVKGSVVFEKQPVEGALVVFTPLAEGRSTAGTTDAKGGFFMITPGAKKSGCVPGKYKVSIVKKTMVDSKGTPVVIAPEMYGGNHILPDYNFKSFLPKKYDDPETSGLIAEVKRRGKNRFEFVLEGK